MSITPPESETLRRENQEARVARSRLRLSTRRSYEVWIGNYIVPEWGECPITSLQQPRPVQLWLNSLAPKLGSKSRREIQARLRNIIDYAQFAGYLPIERNPMELVRIPGSSKRTREPRSLTVEEFRRFLEHLDEPFRSIALVCGLLGLRISEGLALKWLDLNWLELEVKIERGIVAGNVDDVKTRASDKTLHLSQDLITALKTWRQITEFSADDDSIFASPTMLGKKPWSYYTVRRKFLKAATEAGIGWLGTHSMRHSFRSWLDGVGTKVTIQQKAMRHSNIGITMKYGESDRGAIRRPRKK